MTQGKKMPAFRLKYKARDGAKYDVGVAWPATTKDGRVMDGLYGLRPERETDLHAQYPKMKLSEAAKRVEEGDGYLDLSAPKSSGAVKQTGGSARHTDEWSSGGTDDDLPF